LTDPGAKERRMSTKAPEAGTLRGKLLCIEDNPVYMELVEALVAEFPGVELLKAFTGAEGIRLAREQRPDMVLLDMHLPDIGGLEVVRSLSEQISQRELRVVLLTADDFSMDVVKAMSLGAHDHWRKPLTKERLHLGLAGMLSAARAPAADPPKAA
jgi:CheY-like chemotaxis protein